MRTPQLIWATFSVISTLTLVLGTKGLLEAADAAPVLVFSEGTGGGDRKPAWDEGGGKRDRKPAWDEDGGKKD